MYCILITNKWTKYERLYHLVFETEQEAVDYIKSRSAFHKWNNELKIFKLVEI